MNREEIMKLEAGRELDALIAERVMGYGTSYKKGDVVQFGRGIMRDDGVELLEDCTLDERGNVLHPPRYSTDIAAAWQVVDWFRKPPYRWFEMAYRPNGYVANFTGNQCDTVFGETAPLAICRAALLAMLAGAE